MPGKKMRSIKNERIYHALRKKGYSKAKAAKISNSKAGKGGKKAKRGKKRKK